MTHDARDRVLAYRDPAVLHAAVTARGIAALVDEVNAAAYADPDPAVQTVAHIVRLALNRPYPPESPPEAYAVQQVRDAAHHQSLDEWAAACDAWLAGRVHFAALPESRWPSHIALIERPSLSAAPSGTLSLSSGEFVTWNSHRSNDITVWDAAMHTRVLCIGHTNGVREVQELRDGRLMSYDQQGTVRLWRTDGTPLAVMDGHLRRIDAHELSDGRLLTSSYADSDAPGPIRLWTAEGAPLGVLPHSDGLRIVGELAFGRLLLAEPGWTDPRMYIYDLDGTRLAALDYEGRRLRSVLALPDGRFVTDGETLRRWDADGAVSVVLEAAQKDCWFHALTLPDGRLLSWRSAGYKGSPDGTLRLWASDGTLLRVFADHPWSVTGARALHSGRLLTWSDATLHLWSAEGDLIAVMDGHTAKITTVHEMRDGVIASHTIGWMDEAIEWDEYLRVWNANGQPLAVQHMGHGTFESARLSPDRLFFTIGNRVQGSRFSVWSITGGPNAVMRVGHPGEANVRTLSDGRLISWNADDRHDPLLRLWSGEGAALAVLTAPDHGRIVQVLELRNGRLLTRSEYGALRVWSVGHPVENELSDDAPLLQRASHAGTLGGMIQLADGRLLTWTSLGRVHLWGEDGALVRDITEGTGHLVSTIRVLADGTLLVPEYNGRVFRLWSLEGELLRVVTVETDPVFMVFPLPDGRFVTGAHLSHSGQMCLWSAQGDPIAVMDGHTAPMVDVRQTAAGHLVTSGEDGRLIVWTADGVPLRIVTGHSSEFRLNLLDDGRLFSWGRDNRLCLWSADGDLLGLYSGQGWLSSCEFRDTGHITVSDHDGRVMALALRG